MVKILSTLLKADAGTARVNGFDVATQAALLADHRVHGRLGRRRFGEIRLVGDDRPQLRDARPKPITRRGRRPASAPRCDLTRAAVRASASPCCPG
jgi:hypothetical protein